MVTTVTTVNGNVGFLCVHLLVMVTTVTTVNGNVGSICLNVNSVELNAKEMNDSCALIFSGGVLYCI